MSIKRLESSCHSFLAVVTCCLLFTGCGFSVQIKEPTEPFSVVQPLVKAIHLNLEKVTVDSNYPLDMTHAREMLSQKLSMAMRESGLVQDVLPSGNYSDLGIPTLNIITQVKLTSSASARLFKVILGIIFFPFLPFVDIGYDCTLTASIMPVVTMLPVPTRVTSEMTVTHKIMSFDGMPDKTIAALAEDLSWKIALELKRHPAWLQQANMTGRP